MSDIAIDFLVANLAAGIAILLVILLRKPARSLFGARMAYALWLLIPVAPIVTLLPGPPRIVEVVTLPQSVQPMPGAQPAAMPSIDVAMPAPTAAPAPAFAQIASQSTDPWLAATWVWIAGILAMVAWLLRGQSRFMDDARAGFAGPAVAGFIKPRIITPADFEERFEPAEREMILAHETIHIDHNDARINAFVALVRCICWFNPAIHVAAHLMRIDQELACDALVVERHPRARAIYASALLKAQLAARPLPLGCYWPAQDEHPLTERVEMLKRLSPNRARQTIGGGALLLLAMGAGYAAWAAQPGPVQVVQREKSPAAFGLAQPDIAAPAPANQTPAPAPQDRSQELPPPPMQQSALPVAENMIAVGPPPVLDVNAPVYLRGKVERIDFGDTKYVAFLRASSIARIYRNYTRAAFPNTDLWELSATNYFGDRDAIRADLMGKNIEVSGLKMTKDCKPACRIKVKDLIMPRSSQAPQPRADESLLTQFGNWYDTSASQMVRGKVERIEFSDRTFDAYIRSESRGAIPGRLYQARSEYHFPKADIERELLNKAVVATGWRAREGINTFCDPVCGLYATGWEFSDRSRLTPAGTTLVTPSPYLGQPRGDILMSIADFDAPITLNGKITRYIPNVLGADNPQLWIEASGVSPETTFGSKAGTVWVVAGFPFNPQDEWVGKNVAIRGFNVEDKRCQPQCLMAGTGLSIPVEQ
ncbi:MAG: M56 family metallopeptidase [Hyphomonadaceae bacterium]|nr:M56 family metallopeptidase [Hyphomonadaceae bacterium]